MKKLLIVLLLITITLPLQSQDITNKLGASGNYEVTDSGDNVLLQVQSDGDVLIGTTATSVKLSVESNNKGAVYGNQSSNTGSDYGVYGNSEAETGIGVKGTAGPTGANFGGHFSSTAMEGTGVYGEGYQFGGYFKSSAFPNGVGLYSKGSTYAGIFDGAVSVSGPVTIKTFINLESASIDLSDGDILIPSTSYMRVYPLTNITLDNTTAIADGVEVGQVLFIQNVNSSYTITIPTGANVRGVSNITIGNYGTIQLLWGGADWVYINN